MSFIPVPNGRKATFNYSLNGIPVANVLYFEKVGAATLENLETDAEAIINSWEVQIMPLLSNRLSFNSLELRDATNESGLVVIETDSLPATGGVDSVVANNVAMTVTLQTGFAGRSYRGRTYLPGIPTLVYQNQLFTTVFTAAVQTAYENFWEAMETAGLTLGVASFQNGGLPRSEAELTPVIAVRANQQVHTMKKRLT